MKKILILLMCLISLSVMAKSISLENNTFRNKTVEIFKYDTDKNIWKLSMTIEMKKRSTFTYELEDDEFCYNYGFKLVNYSYFITLFPCHIVKLY